MQLSTETSAQSQVFKCLSPLRHVLGISRVLLTGATILSGTVGCYELTCNFPIPALESPISQETMVPLSGKRQQLLL